MERLACCKLSIQEIEQDAEDVHFYREKNSHKGIGNLSSIKHLFAKQVNQDFLNEICELVGLERLDLEIVTAIDIRPLASLYPIFDF
jgi:hypothetical protein